MAMAFRSDWNRMGRMNKKKRPVGRPKKTASEKRGERAVCWLAAGEKKSVQEASHERGQSESTLIRAGLIAIEVIVDR